MIAAGEEKQASANSVSDLFLLIEQRIIRLLISIGYSAKIPADMTQTQKERFYSDLNNYIIRQDALTALDPHTSLEEIVQSEIYTTTIDSCNPFHISHLMKIIEIYYEDKLFVETLTAIAHRIPVIQSDYPLFGEYLFLQLFNIQLLNSPPERKNSINNAIAECYSKIERILDTETKNPMDAILLNTNSSGQELHFLPVQNVVITREFTSRYH